MNIITTAEKLYHASPLVDGRAIISQRDGSDEPDQWLVRFGQGARTTYARCYRHKDAIRLLAPGERIRVQRYDQ